MLGTGRSLQPAVSCLDQEKPAQLLKRAIPLLLRPDQRRRRTAILIERQPRRDGFRERARSSHCERPHRSWQRHDSERPTEQTTGRLPGQPLLAGRDTACLGFGVAIGPGASREAARAPRSRPDDQQRVHSPGHLLPAARCLRVGGLAANTAAPRTCASGREEQRGVVFAYSGRRVLRR